jgi:hypothetical protein
MERSTLHEQVTIVSLESIDGIDPDPARRAAGFGISVE